VAKVFHRAEPTSTGSPAVPAAAFTATALRPKFQAHRGAMPWRLASPDLRPS